jgi:hypothetical protein
MVRLRPNGSTIRNATSVKRKLTDAMMRPTPVGLLNPKAAKMEAE